MIQLCQKLKSSYHAIQHCAIRYYKSVKFLLQNSKERANVRICSYICFSFLILCNKTSRILHRLRRDSGVLVTLVIYIQIKCQLGEIRYNQCQSRPTKINQDPPGPIQVNWGQPGPVNVLLCQSRPIWAGMSQLRPTSTRDRLETN